MQMTQTHKLMTPTVTLDWLSKMDNLKIKVNKITGNKQVQFLSKIDDHNVTVAHFIYESSIL